MPPMQIYEKYGLFRRKSELNIEKRTAIYNREEELADAGFFNSFDDDFDDNDIYRIK